MPKKRRRLELSFESCWFLLSLHMLRYDSQALSTKLGLFNLWGYSQTLKLVLLWQVLQRRQLMACPRFETSAAVLFSENGLMMVAHLPCWCLAGGTESCFQEKRPFCRRAQWNYMWRMKPSESCTRTKKEVKSRLEVRRAGLRHDEGKLLNHGMCVLWSVMKVS